MSKKIIQLERLKSRALRVALTAFRAEPLLGQRHAQLLFSEILYLVKSGKDDETIVSELVQKYRAKTVSPSGTLSAL